MNNLHRSTAMTAFLLSLASLTLPPVGDVHAADIFTKITAGPGSDVGNSQGAAWGDYDNDGFIDLFVPQPPGSGSGSHFFYPNNANGTFSRVTTGPVGTLVSDGRAAVWGDYDNDGYLDLVLVNANQSNHLFHNNGNGSFAAVPGAAIVFDPADSWGVTWVDYDNDGSVDLFRTAQRDSRRLYHNNQNGTFTRITQGDFLTVPGNFFAVAWGDYNNDGRPDLFLPQADEASGLPNYLYRNDGDGTFTRVGAGPLDGGSNGRAAAWGDYDNDGDRDLFVACFSTEGRPNRFYRNNGDDTFTSLTSLPANDPANQGGASVGCNWGDYDNDGFLDLFVGNPAGAGFLYHNHKNDNQWLKLHLVGTRSNRAAIGAKVRVRATINGQSFWQMREVPGGDGRNGHNSPYIHVGLGNATNGSWCSIASSRSCWSTRIHSAPWKCPSDSRQPAWCRGGSWRFSNGRHDAGRGWSRNSSSVRGCRPLNSPGDERAGIQRERRGPVPAAHRVRGESAQFVARKGPQLLSGFRIALSTRLTSPSVLALAILFRGTQGLLPTHP